eukprot:gb/GECH01007602.1/.p1 GENE.gb/GECH01007602.1/~~gb/GECH01007602.1/.p1  ORF type:complete len:669 (+),score=131.67 gb/GECH01007602.1/:1-2007(+)
MGLICSLILNPSMERFNTVEGMKPLVSRICFLTAFFGIIQIFAFALVTHTISSIIFLALGVAALLFSIIGFNGIKNQSLISLSIFCSFLGFRIIVNIIECILFVINLIRVINGSKPIGTFSYGMSIYFLTFFIRILWFIIVLRYLYFIHRERRQLEVVRSVNIALRNDVDGMELEDDFDDNNNINNYNNNIKQQQKQDNQDIEMQDGEDTSTDPHKRSSSTIPSVEEDITMMDDEEDEGKDYTWTRHFKRSWEEVEEKGGVLQMDQLEREEHRRRKRRRTLQQQQQREKGITGVVQRGMIRYMYLVLDMSISVNENDLKPSRKILITDTAQAFIREFFDQNPLSQLGIIVTRDGRAETIVEHTGNFRECLHALKRIPKPAGEPSLQNSVDVARLALRGVPSYGSRELVVIWSSLVTRDHGDIFQSIEQLQRDRIRCSVIGLGAELFVCRKLVEKTGGTYSIPMHEDHFRELFFSHTSPPPKTQRSSSSSGGDVQQQRASMIRMGFPQRRGDTLSLCTCHKKLRPGGFVCPRCRSKYCQLPTVCKICGLTLVSSPHLARSYHHLFPVPPFSEMDGDGPGDVTRGKENGDARASEQNHHRDGIGKEEVEGEGKGTRTSKTQYCHSCLAACTAVSLQCPNCRGVFCGDCDAFIHESLHNCPGCESASTVAH